MELQQKTKCKFVKLLRHKIYVITELWWLCSASLSRCKHEPCSRILALTVTDSEPKKLDISVCLQGLCCRHHWKAIPMSHIYYCRRDKNGMNSSLSCFETIWSRFAVGPVYMLFQKIEIIVKYILSGYLWHFNVTVVNPQVHVLKYDLVSQSSVVYVNPKWCSNKFKSIKEIECQPKKELCEGLHVFYRFPSFKVPKSRNSKHKLVQAILYLDLN